MQRDEWLVHITKRKTTTSTNKSYRQKTLWISYMNNPTELLAGNCNNHNSQTIIRDWWWSRWSFLCRFDIVHSLLLVCVLSFSVSMFFCCKSTTLTSNRDDDDDREYISFISNVLYLSIIYVYNMFLIVTGRSFSLIFFRLSVTIHITPAIYLSIHLSFYYPNLLRVGDFFFTFSLQALHVISWLCVCVSLYKM